jgi:GNAT superfamily N-acetyltransferase
MTLGKSDAEAFYVESPDLGAADLQLLFADLYPPTDVETRGDWVFRHSDKESDGTWGSVRVVGNPGDLNSTLSSIESWYQRRGMIPRLQVPSPSFHDAALIELGWVVEYVVDALTAPLERLAGLPSKHKVELRQVSPSDRPYSPSGTIVGEVLLNGSAIGQGRGRISSPKKHDCPTFLGLTSFQTARDRRRTGVATSIIAALAGDAMRKGATLSFLQVIANNMDGLYTYQSLGFEHHHTYQYWIPNSSIANKPGGSQ